MELMGPSRRVLWRRLVLLPVLGASVHVVQKFLFEVEAEGVGGVHKFQKPLFFTWLGSCGMFVTFCVNSVRNARRVWVWRPVVLLGVSTVFNLSAGALANVSMLYLNYSVSLMLRSSTVIFGALISVFYMKRPLMKFQLVGLVLTVVAIVIISVSALGSGSHTTHREASGSVTAWYIVVRTLSKSLQAVAMIVEEYVMNNYEMTPVEASGVSGVWSFVFASVLLLPFEDVRDTVAMIGSSPLIVVLCLVSIVVFAVWNILAMQVTKKVSAVARMIFDQLTIVVVWVVQVLVHWMVRGTEYEARYGRAGEAWTRWSWLQLLGFAVMVLGACVYQKIIQFESLRDDIQV